jgi:hypothetical protein
VQLASLQAPGWQQLRQTLEIGGGEGLGGHGSGDCGPKGWA